MRFAVNARRIICIEPSEGEFLPAEVCPKTGLVKPLGRGSTGRTVAKDFYEQLAMKEVMSNPHPYLGKSTILELKMTDKRWPAEEGWVKVVKNINPVKATKEMKKPKGIEIHYVWNKILNIYDDFKFAM